MLAAAAAGSVWCALDWRLERKWSMVGFCSGTIAGLVAATPASGYIPTWAAVLMGVTIGVIANFATKRESCSTPRLHNGPDALISQILLPR